MFLERETENGTLVCEVYWLCNLGLLFLTSIPSHRMIFSFGFLSDHLSLLELLLKNLSLNFADLLKENMEQEC